MTSKNVLFLILSIFLTFLSGCKKFVAIPPPTTEIVTASTFNDNATAISTQLSIYAQLNNYEWPYTLNFYSGLSSDELQPYTSGTPADLYANTLNAENNGASIGFWATIYNYIYQENAIIENVTNSNNLSAIVKKELTAEAKFNRAYWYFYLVNLYGDVALVTSTNYSSNSRLSRTNSSIVYQQIISDLKAASDSLSDNFIDETDTTVTEDRVRPTTWAAKALLARVYLYTGNWQQAAAMASGVISNQNQFQLVPLNQVFLANSKEAIWQLMPPPNQPYTWEGYNFVLTQAPAYNNSTLDSQLVNAFEPNDGRKMTWVGQYLNGSDTLYYAHKYQTNVLSVGSSNEYSMVLRLAELYLIRAEAEAQENDLVNAIADVNIIRARATGIHPLSGNLTQSQVLAAIAQERRVELFTEGDRWLNLKRTHAVDSVMQVVTPKKVGAVWQSYQQLYPIPVSDILADPNLDQNDGY